MKVVKGNFFFFTGGEGVVGSLLAPANPQSEAESSW